MAYTFFDLCLNSENAHDLVFFSFFSTRMYVFLSLKEKASPTSLRVVREMPQSSLTGNAVRRAFVLCVGALSFESPSLSTCLPLFIS